MAEKERTDNLNGEAQDRDVDPLGIIGWELAGKYRITAYIGSGGFAEVYEGYNTALVDQRIVVKFIKKTYPTDKVQKEAKILSLLDHPNICGIVDFLPDDRALVVPYINGENCEQIVGESGPLPESLFIKVTQTVLDTLVFAHKRRIAHRDLKPSNIMIDKHGHVYLIDFGIAKEIGGTVTKTGYRALTPQFAAPERQRGERAYNPFLSDIYEVGVTLYYLATKHMPYLDPVHPHPGWWGSPADKHVSGELLRILKKATHPDPSKRFQSAEEMVQKMSRLKGVYRRPKRRYLLAGTMLLAALLAVSGYTYRARVFQLWDDLRSRVFADSRNSTGGETEPAIAVETTHAKPPDTISLKTPTVTEIPQLSDKKPERTISTEKKDTSIQQPPQPPIMPNLTVRVLPRANATLLVDGLAKQVGRSFATDPGHHTVTIMHPDFPILEKSVDIKKDTVVAFDMANEFAGTESFILQIGAAPRDANATLRVAFNKQYQDYQKLSVRALEKLVGKWQVKFDVFPEGGDAGATARVDSFVVKPGFGGRPKETIWSNGSILDFGEVSWGSKKLSHIVVYWSKE
jgi:serine/threonine protein kinase